MDIETLEHCDGATQIMPYSYLSSPAYNVTSHLCVCSSAAAYYWSALYPAG